MKVKAKPIRMYTTSWCGDSFRAKSFLERHGIAFEEIDIEKHEDAVQTVVRANNGRRRTPTFEIEGQFYSNPPITELARLIGVEEGAAPASNAVRQTAR